MSKGLGRGFASLIPDSALDVEAGPLDQAGSRTVPLDEIRPNPEQPREVFDKEALESLAASIRQHGLLTPLVVRRHEGRYVLIAGERRFRAAGLAGLTEVPVMVREADDASVQLELALVENLQRTDLDPVEEARGYKRLVDEYGYTQDQVAVRVGRQRPTIANALRLLKLPEFALLALRDGRITAGHARALLPLDDETAVKTVLAKVIAQGLSVRATERMVRDLTRAPVPRTGDDGENRRAMDYATRLLRDALRTSVAILPKKKGGGRIVIDYADAEDLERLIHRLRQE
ncbi:MAG: ParB/RepB/Spo0J family partition protein [Myxococcales bacterium]|nr:ParB/RepB/Spo0J family partition protein [Myxococcales bacterium]MCB9669931.1 ParB/RepB/Spo0J family partition protein [Alphaproteobacteria bacterium]MCB9693195.1 ParB/RepB/Spo0J family partition protein [Alphaproteobacteria bacterium]